MGYREAETLLLDSYEILKATVVQHDPRMIDATRRLTTLYQFWGEPRKAAAYAASLSQKEAARH